MRGLPPNCGNHSEAGAGRSRVRVNVDEAHDEECARRGYRDNSARLKAAATTSNAPVLGERICTELERARHAVPLRTNCGGASQESRDERQGSRVASYESGLRRVS